MKVVAVETIEWTYLSSSVGVMSSREVPVEGEVTDETVEIESVENADVGIVVGEAGWLGSPCLHCMLQVEGGGGGRAFLVSQRRRAVLAVNAVEVGRI
jgi:hypothetical protein